MEEQFHPRIIAGIGCLRATDCLEYFRGRWLCGNRHSVSVPAATNLPALRSIDS